MKRFLLLLIIGAFVIGCNKKEPELNERPPQLDEYEEYNWPKVNYTILDKEATLSLLFTKEFQITSVSRILLNGDVIDEDCLDALSQHIYFGVQMYKVGINNQNGFKGYDQSGTLQDSFLFRLSKDMEDKYFIYKNKEIVSKPVFSLLYEVHSISEDGKELNLVTKVNDTYYLLEYRSN